MCVGGGGEGLGGGGDCKGRRGKDGVEGLSFAVISERNWHRLEESLPVPDDGNGLTITLARLPSSLPPPPLPPPVHFASPARFFSPHPSPNC